MKPMAPEFTSICVLYDPAGGQVVHIHRVMTYPGGRHPDQNGVEQRCIETAESLGHATKGMATLHVEPGALKPNSSFRVDIRSRKLVAVAGPSFRPRR